MNSPVIFLTIGIGFAFVFQGCVSSGNPSVVDQDRIAQIKLDVSTKEDVRGILGQPNSMSKHSGSYSAVYGLPPTISLSSFEVWNYTHMTVDVDAATFIPIVGLFVGGATSNLNSFTVIFDDQGIVRHISTMQVQGRSGLGAGTPSETETETETEQY